MRVEKHAIKPQNYKCNRGASRLRQLIMNTNESAKPGLQPLPTLPNQVMRGRVSRDHSNISVRNLPDNFPTVNIAGTKHFLSFFACHSMCCISNADEFRTATTGFVATQKTNREKIFHEAGSGNQLNPTFHSLLTA